MFKGQARFNYCAQIYIFFYCCASLTDRQLVCKGETMSGLFPKSAIISIVLATLIFILPPQGNGQCLTPKFHILCLCCDSGGDLTYWICFWSAAACRIAEPRAAMDQVRYRRKQQFPLTLLCCSRQHHSVSFLTNCECLGY